MYLWHPVPGFRSPAPEHPGCRVAVHSPRTESASPTHRERYLDLQTAEKTLLEAQERFPEEATIPFNLACYACQLGRLDEAREKLAKAVGMEPAFKKTALEDEDLKAIW